MRDRLDNGDVRPFVLYLMSKALPKHGRWKAFPSTVHAIVEDIEAIGEDGSDVEGIEWRCGELRRGARPGRLKLRKAPINQLKARLDLVQPKINLIKAATKVVPNVRGGVAAAVNAAIGVSPGEILGFLANDTFKSLIGRIDKKLALRMATIDVRLTRIDLACADR